MINRFVAQGMSALILLFGVYEIYDTGFVSKVASMVTIFSGNTDASFSGEIHGVNTKLDQDLPTHRETRNGEMPSFPEGEKRGSAVGLKDEMGSANVFGVIATFTGIMAVFIIIKYYISMLQKRRKIGEIHNIEGS